MATEFRVLNDLGIARFTEYIRQGAIGPPPRLLLNDSATSEKLKGRINSPGTGIFPDRYMFGCYLRTLLKELDTTDISGDRGLWSTLALHWFDRLCPADANEKRAVREEYHYILSADYRHYYRHLVRSPWQLVKDHGQESRFLLISPREHRHPLSVHGEILEQFGGRQQVFSSKTIIRAANRLYFDEQKNRPKSGVAGRGRGSARRFGLVLRQLDLTYDPESMTDRALLDILPEEFDKWRKPAPPTK